MPRQPRRRLAGAGRLLILTFALLSAAAGIAHAGGLVFTGGLGSDVYAGSAEDDSMSGMDDADYFRGKDGDDQLDGGAGPDALIGDEPTTEGFDQLNGGPGDDEIAGGAFTDQEHGGDGDDIIGSIDFSDVAGPSVIDFHNDALYGDAGNDVIDAGPGDDHAEGGSGEDMVKGGDGKDTLIGGSGTDQIDGGAGDDNVEARDGEVDVVACGDGQDSVSADRRDDVGADCEDVEVPPLPQISIADAATIEGDSGHSAIAFDVALDGAADEAVSVRYATGGGTASAPGDFERASGSLTIAPGETSGQITIEVAGDTAIERDETFDVDLSDPQGATIARARGIGTIRDDDTPSAQEITHGLDAMKLKPDPGKGVIHATFDAPSSGRLTFAPAGRGGDGGGRVLRRSKHGAPVKPIAVNVSKPGPMKATIQLTRAGKARLRHKHRLVVKLIASFAPTGGKAVTDSRSVTFKPKRKRGK
jgi:hypothetical protein